MLWQSFLSRPHWLVLLCSAKFQTSIYMRCINCIGGRIFLSLSVFHFAWQWCFWAVWQKQASAHTHHAKIPLKGRCLVSRAFFCVSPHSFRCYSPSALTPEALSGSTCSAGVRCLWWMEVVFCRLFSSLTKATLSAMQDHFLIMYLV